MQPTANKHIRYLTMTGIFIALVFVTTNFLRVPIPLAGYIHPGDTFIYLAACFLPLPYAMVAGSVGATLSDALAAPIYIPATLVIKAVLTLFFARKSDKFLTVRNGIGCILAGLTGLFGYFIYESFIYHNVIAAALNMLPGSIQPLISAVLFILLCYALDKSNVKKRFQID